MERETRSIFRALNIPRAKDIAKSKPEPFGDIEVLRELTPAQVMVMKLPQQTGQKSVPESQIVHQNSKKICKPKHEAASYKVVRVRSKDTRRFQQTLICDVCGYSFAKQAAMKNHLRSHTREKPFPCRGCFKQFSQAANRDRHERL